MSLPHTALLALIFISFSTTGCLMHRTIKDGNEVVAEGYIVKPPLSPLIVP